MSNVSYFLFFFFFPCYVYKVVLLSETFDRRDQGGSSTWIYLPGQVCIAGGGGEEVGVQLLYGLRVDGSVDLQSTALRDPGNHIMKEGEYYWFRHSVLARFGGSEASSQSYARVVITSRYKIPTTVKYARFFLYGFVPNPLNVTAAMRTKEFGFLGGYLREYVNLRCMGTGEHVLEYDGVEQGVYRLNADNSIGRELIDMYTGLFTNKAWWVLSALLLATTTALTVIYPPPITLLSSVTYSAYCEQVLDRLYSHCRTGEAADVHVINRVNFADATLGQLAAIYQVVRFCVISIFTVVVTENPKLCMICC